RPAPDPGLISLVIPVYNERESLPALLAEIDEAVRPLARRVEVIFVDDGSRDGSWDVVRDLATKDARVSGIRFRRNFGKAAALQAGFARAAGGVVFTLDADLQDDPHEIPRFLGHLDAGFDVVSGWKKIRHDPWHKVFPSRVFNGMLSIVTGVKLHDHNCGFKAYRGEVTRDVRLYGELHRFVPVLAAAKGYAVGELIVQHRARKFGHSKFGARRFVKGFLDLVSVRFTTEFGQRPMHLLGTVALLAAAVGVLGLAIVLLLDLTATRQMAAFPIVVGTVLSVGFLLFASQAALAGLVAELLVAKTAATAEPFEVAEETE
ncbi:MAG: glycosyltransferase family 2 protein, partial [Fimbriiglobus sp.]